MYTHMHCIYIYINKYNLFSTYNVLVCMLIGMTIWYWTTYWCGLLWQKIILELLKCNTILLRFSHTV